MNWSSTQSHVRSRICSHMLVSGVFTILMLWACGSVLACSVPVFRYALERWPADRFEALVYCRGGLSDADQALFAAQSVKSGNLDFRLVDLDTETDADILGLWNDEGIDTLPWCVLTYPGAYPFLGPVTTSAWSVGALNVMLHSPMRRHLGSRLSTGDTAVWILLESGDQALDDAVATRLEGRLRHLESDLKLPTLEQEDIDAGLVSVTQDELKIAFSMVRLSRNDPNESVLVEMLLDSEEDLSDQDGPIVYPVFGRGRALYALVGDGINVGTIDQAAEYIVGACSCQVKEQNPGVDLLLAIDWDAAIGKSQIAERDLPPLEGAGVLLEAPDVTQDDSAPASVETVDAEVRSTASATTIFAVIGSGLLVMVIAGSLFILKRNPSN